MSDDEIQKLKEENERLKKMNETKSDLIAISAHQLRTSLSALKWTLKMFIDNDLGKITEEQEMFIKKAYQSNEQMIVLVNDLLTLNHAEDVAISFKFQKVDIVELIEQTLFEFSGETHKKNIELVFINPESKIPELNCDKEMIRVVLQNLVENAIKYSNEKNKIFINIKYSDRDKNVEISIHDTGIGIDKSDQANIFSKFFRAQNAIKKEDIGSGLGLYTTKNIVDHHNGKIWFESDKKNGTTFHVILPIS